MKALIDADWFAYAHGGAKDDEGNPLSWPLVASRINQQIANIVKASGADEYKLYLTGSGNFRERVATIRPYKGNRPSEKPHHYERVRDYLLKFRNAELVTGIEADDRVSIEQYNAIDRSIICSIDKDLDNTPGWHYNWIKDERYYLDETSSLRAFYKQLLIGDNVDNIPGLFGIGKSSSIVKSLWDLDSEHDMYSIVREQYKKRFGSYCRMFLLENGILLWMLRKEPSDVTGPEGEFMEKLSELESL